MCPKFDLLAKKKKLPAPMKCEGLPDGIIKKVCLKQTSQQWVPAWLAMRSSTGIIDWMLFA